MTEIFAVGRGQYENVGDIILRRHLLDWVRPLGRLHVYLGASPDGYEEGLRLQDGDVGYRSFARWYAAAMASAARGRASYVFKPGDIQLTLIGMKEHLSMLPLLATIRARGGRAIRVGSGVSNFAPVPRALMGPSIALSDLTLWRDVGTAAYMGIGDSMPDLAFGEGADDAELEYFGEVTQDRHALVISLRADDPVPAYPSSQWLAGVREFAEANSLQIWAVTQVHVDNDRNQRLARDLGAELLAWEHLSGHDRQEERLRWLYRRTAVALSDRLHVIIAAFTEGAIPVGVLGNTSDKIDRHFQTIGISGITMNTVAGDTRGVVDELATLSLRRREMFAKLSAARAELHQSRSLVERTLARNGQLVRAIHPAGEITP